MSKVYQPGDPAVLARDLNRFGEAADKVLSNAPRSILASPAAKPNVILIKNNSGSAVDRYAVLGLGDVEITYASNSTQFLDSIVLDGELPLSDSHQNNFAVALEPIPSGGVGRAIASGLVQCQVEMKETWHEFVDIKHSSSASLVSAPGSCSRILWVAGTTGTQWAIVNIGGGKPEPTWAVITGAGSNSNAFEATEYKPYFGPNVVRYVVATGRTFTAADMGEITTQNQVLPIDGVRYPVSWIREPNGGVDPDAYHAYIDNMPYASSAIFQVRLNLEAGGSAGDAETQSSYTYEATDNSGNVLRTGIDPSSGSGSDYLRPPVGKMVAGNRGAGYFSSGGNFVLSWCNERLDLGDVEVVNSVDFGAETVTTTKVSSPGTA